MEIERGRLSETECKALAIITVIVMLAAMFGPNAYLAITGKPAAGKVSAVPKYGTVQYQEYMERFEQEHGREWNVQDELTATRNGAYLISGLIGLVMATITTFEMVHDLRCWRYEKKAYRNRWTDVPPMEAREQLGRVLFYLAVIVPSGCFLYLIVPMLVTPIA